MKDVASRRERRTVGGIESDGLTGRRIAQARRSAGLSQRRLAELLGVSLRTVQNYEAGKFLPFRHLDELSALLGHSRGWLLHGDDGPMVEELLTRLREERRRLGENVARMHVLAAQLADARNAASRYER